VVIDRSAARDEIPDLLRRPPTGTREFVAAWADVLVDPVRQLDSLADLTAMGLLSQSEYERYRLQVRDL
jgi:hypothetical protein